MGADDFVTKPVSDREIVLRARAVLRRKHLHSVSSRQLPVRAGPVVLDPDAHRAQIEGEDVDLTLLEFKLLWTLASRKGTVLPRETLLSDVWGPLINVELRTVDQHVKRLRAKLGSARSLIHTVRGIGYRFELS
jgi:two-component system phosphate regulon response regulator PhoB